MSHQSEHQPTASEGLLGINEVVELTGISAFTIRYYDKCGFFPNLIRGKRGVRSFKPSDVKQLKLVDALRRSGLSIEGIRYFVRLSKAMKKPKRINALSSKPKRRRSNIRSPRPRKASSCCAKNLRA